MDIMNRTPSPVAGESDVPKNKKKKIMEKSSQKRNNSKLASRSNSEIRQTKQREGVQVTFLQWQ